jgi:hypothetical protein
MIPPSNEHASVPPKQSHGTPDSTAPASSVPPSTPSVPRTVSCIEALELALLYPGWKPYAKPSAPPRHP